jgi:hypothetical protein
MGYGGPGSPTFTLHNAIGDIEIVPRSGNNTKFRGTSGMFMIQSDGGGEQSRWWYGGAGSNATRQGWSYGTNSWFTYNSSTSRFEALNYAGTAWVDIGAKAWYTASSEKWKEDIVDEPIKGLDVVKRSRVKRYRHKTDPIDLESTGLIAEDTPKEILNQEGDMIDMYKMISFAYKAIQELSDKVKLLEDGLQGYSVPVKPNK